MSAFAKEDYSKAPRLEQVDEWQEAFITSTVRLVSPVTLVRYHGRSQADPASRADLRLPLDCERVLPPESRLAAHIAQLVQEKLSLL